MDSVLPVITYGGGDLLREFFNAIVMSLGDDSFKTLLRLTLLLGGTWALFESMVKRNVLLNLKWVALYILLTNILFVPKASIEIIDQTQSGTSYIVDHVPLGLAVLAHLTSTIGDSLTQLTEKNFTALGDLRYGKTGMVFASSVVVASSQFEITNPEFSESLQSYVQQCVFYDLLLNRYSLNDLLNTPKLWDFLKDNSSKARAFLYKGHVTVCHDGAVALDVDWKAAITEAAAKYGPQLLRNSSDAQAELLKYLQTGYEFLTKLSDQGADILKQNLLATQISEGLQRFGATTNSTAALEAYAFARAQSQKRMTNQTMGDMAAYWLPLMKICFEGILYGSFIFVFLLSLFPFGLSVLKHYVASLMWIQLWAPLYAIINLIVSFYAQSKSITLAMSGLTLSSMGGLAQVNSDMAGLAGYLSLSVPFIAWGLVKGMGASFMQLSQSVGGAIQSSASLAAGEAASGNISMGNTHFANHSMFNTNANHVDTNARYAAGMATVQTQTGSSVSITSGGNEVMDNRGALSNLATTVHVAESIRDAASSQAQSSVTAGLNQVQAAASHYSAAFRECDDVAHQHSAFINSGTSASQTDTTGFTRSAQEVSQLVESFAKDHHISHERAAQVLGQVYADVKAGGGLILKGEVGASASISSSGRSAFGSLYNEAERFATDHHFSKTVDSAHRAAQDSHYRTTQDEGSRLAHSVLSSLDQGDSLRTEAASQFSRAESFARLASTTQENAASINANYTQEFYQWMREQPSLMGQGRLSRSAIENMAVHDPALLQDYAHQFVQQKTKDMLHRSNGDDFCNKEHAVMQRFESNNQTLPSQPVLEGEHQHFNHTIHAEKIGAVDTTIANQVKSEMQHHRDKLNQAQFDLDSKKAPLKENIHDKVEGQVLGSINTIHDFFHPKEPHE